MGFTFEEFPNSDFYNSDLREILKYVRKLITAIDSLEHWKEEHEEEYNELKRYYDALVSGDFPENFLNSLEKWLRTNAIDIIGELVHMVFFGLTDAGYFVAYIPESWNDITFNTTQLDIFLDIQPQFGHLVLSY